MSTIWDFDNIENKHTLYRGRFMKNFRTYLREHATSVINYEMKKMLPLTKEELKSHKKAKACYICGKRFLKNFANDKTIRRLKIIAIMQVKHILLVISNLMYSMKSL